MKIIKLKLTRSFLFLGKNFLKVCEARLASCQIEFCRVAFVVCSVGKATE